MASLMWEGERLPGLHGDAEATMALVLSLFDLAGPRLGCRFVESSYLLTLGDMRPYAGWNGRIRHPHPEDSLILDLLNQVLLPRGLGLMDESGPGHSWNLYSLGGLELRVGQCSMDWVPPFVRDSWWEGFRHWRDSFWKECERRFEPGWGWFDEGFMLGYPDPAILDVPALLKSGWGGATEARIVMADRYRCGLPIFSMRPETSQEPAVQQVEAAWSTFLERAYASPAHAELRQRPGFLLERNVLDAEN